jgi:hypothetical protein
MCVMESVEVSLNVKIIRLKYEKCMEVYERRF